MNVSLLHRKANRFKKIQNVFTTKLPLKLLAVAANFISVYLFIIALSIGETGKVTALYQGLMVVSVLAGIIFLNERRDITKKLIGTAVTLVGVFLLTST